jgi:uncharacterized cupredoxin-like copper-binding protein
MYHIGRDARTVEIDMSDFMLFTPSKIQVKDGETVKFVINNRGQIVHEFVLGTAADLQAHATMMKDHPEMVHEGPGHYTVQPGQNVEFPWQFTSSGNIEFGCLIPGHFDAGMRGRIIVKQ